MTNSNPMASLYRRLQEFGLSTKFVKSTILPSWWDDEVAENPTGYAQGMMLLSRHLGLDLRSLADNQAPIRPRAEGICKFKKAKSTLESDLGLARAMATRAAQLVASATTNPVLPLPENGPQVRQEILGMGHPWVDLSNLTDYCWSGGIPVIHLWTLPKGIKRPDGLAAVVDGRPVIILCRKAKSPARLLFILAHELGHIALGHIENNSVLVDENVRRSNSVDQEEVAADAFALAILTGNSDCRVQYVGQWPAAEQLAMEAKELGTDKRIDPGHIVMNFAFTSGNYALAIAALQYLESHADAPATIRSRMVSKLDWSRLPEDSYEFLLRATKATR